jgi:hypothetical protein
MLKVMGQLPGALESAERAVQLNPRQLKMHDWLAATYRSNDQLDKSRLYETIVKRLRSSRNRTLRPTTSE